MGLVPDNGKQIAAEHTHSTQHPATTTATTTTMKIYYMGVLRPAQNGSKTVSLAEAKDLSSFTFFQRSSVGQFMTFFAQTIAERTSVDQRQSVEEGEYVGHVYVRGEGIAGVIITDKAYPLRPAFTLLNKVCDDFIVQHDRASIPTLAESNGDNDPQLAALLQQYQSPTEADALLKVQQELDETKIVLQQSIENVLQRGEKLDSLVDKSEALTSSSKTFYKQAKKTNSCCVIM
jgi:synaptobrevin family protein YKT6